MFYRPKYCCNCGEKIERANWTLFSSRRFCELCETENKGYEYALRAFAGVAILLGLGGFATYFQRSSPAASLKQGMISAENRGPAAQSKLNGGVNSPAAQTQVLSNSVQSNITPAVSENLKQRENQAKTSTETVYYCGAMTKKGTPCTRRVKTRGRCWQHLGQPAMPGFEKFGPAK